MKTKIYYLGLIKHEKKIAWIKGKLLKGKPVIIVVGDDSYLHYITLLGFTENGFEVYDSLIEENMNGIEKGNITVGYEEMIERMESAEFKRFRIPLGIGF